MPNRHTTTSWQCSSRTTCTRPTSTSSVTVGSSATPAIPSTIAARCGSAAASSTRRRRRTSGRPFPLRVARYARAMLSGWRGGAAPRILIVDDDPNLLVLLADQLRNDGFEIQTARDGEEAL